MRAFAALSILLFAATAHAEEHSRIYSVSAIAGYTAEAESIWTGSPSQYRYGFGLRAGISLPKFYIGLAVVHHVGFSQLARGPNVSYDQRYHTTLFGPEVGYDAHFGEHLFLRPYLGFGGSYTYGRTKISDIEDNDDRLRFQLTPGFILAAQINQITFGVDLRAVLSPITAPVKWAPGAFATVGVRF